VIATGWTLRRTSSLIERNALIYRRSLTPVLSSIVEPVLYLLTIGFGVGTLVGKVAGVDVRYAAFVAPGILATTAMNAAFNQTGFAIFMRIKTERNLRRDRANAAFGRGHRRRRGRERRAQRRARRCWLRTRDARPRPGRLT
jgi:hypothetical protein